MLDKLCGAAILAFFVLAFGCAGQGDYEYAKSKEKMEAILNDNQ